MRLWEFFFGCKWCKWNVNSLRPSDTYVSVNYATISSDNGASPVGRQAIIWTNAGLLSIEPEKTNFNEILIEIQNFSFNKKIQICRLQNGGHCVNASLESVPYKHGTTTWCPHFPSLCLQMALHFTVPYNDVIMTTIASQITSLAFVYSTVYSDADQRKHQSSASLAFVWGIPRDRWIPRTKGQLRGKCFHLMTSSWMGHQQVQRSIQIRKNRDFVYICI